MTVKDFLPGVTKIFQIRQEGCFYRLWTCWARSIHWPMGEDVGPSLQVLLLSVVAEEEDAGEPANSSWEQNRLEFAFRLPVQVAKVSRSTEVRELKETAQRKAEWPQGRRSGRRPCLPSSLFPAPPPTHTHSRSPDLGPDAPEPHP